MKKEKVIIIILNWNNYKDTIECLNSLKDIDYPYFDVILIDNGSSDDSVEKIGEFLEGLINWNISRINFKKTDEKFRDEQFSLFETNFVFIKCDRNYGFTEGNNIAIRFAVEFMKFDFLLLLNNDSIVDKHFLSNMVFMSLNDNEIGLIQPKLLYYDYPQRINSAGNKMDVFGNTDCRGICELDHKQYDEKKFEGFFYPSGACLLITKKFLQDMDYQEFFDSLLFAYHEDVDIGFQARLFGYKIGYCSQAICYHKDGVSLQENMPKRIFLVQRNNLRVLIKNYTFLNLVWILPLTITFDFVVSVGSSVYNRRYIFLSIFFKSIFWNIGNLKNTLEKRSQIQSKRRVNDKAVMKYMIFKPTKIYGYLRLIFS